MPVHFSRCACGARMWMCFDQCASADWKRALSRQEHYQSMQRQYLLHSKQRRCWQRYCQAPVLIISLMNRRRWKCVGMDAVDASQFTGMWLIISLFPPHNNAETMCHPMLHGKIKGWLYIQPAEPQPTAHRPQWDIYNIQTDSLQMHGRFERFCHHTRRRLIRTFVWRFPHSCDVGKKPQFSAKC